MPATCPPRDLFTMCITHLDLTCEWYNPYHGAAWAYSETLCYTMPPVPYTPTTMAGRADYLHVGTHYQGYSLCAVCTTTACQPLPQGGA